MSPYAERMGKRRIVCFALAALTILAGLAWRFAPLGLPPFFFKYGGSMLWAMMVYWIAAALLPTRRPLELAVYSCVTAALVEFSRLLHTPALDHVRITLAGRLLLGRFFSLWDIVAYWLAIGIVAVVDSIATRSRSS